MMANWQSSHKTSALYKQTGTPDIQEQSDSLQLWPWWDQNHAMVS